MDTTVTVRRPGRTIELVEATLSHGGRPAVTVRAWLLQSRDTQAFAGSALPRIPAPADTETWDPTTVWPGGFIRNAQLRRAQSEPGRAHFWVRTDEPLVADAPLRPR